MLHWGVALIPINVECTRGYKPYLAPRERFLHASCNRDLACNPDHAKHPFLFLHNYTECLKKFTCHGIGTKRHFELYVVPYFYPHAVWIPAYLHVEIWGLCPYEAQGPGHVLGYVSELGFHVCFEKRFFTENVFINVLGIVCLKFSGWEREMGIKSIRFV